jgi:hypothetical protein
LLSLLRGRHTSGSTTVPVPRAQGKVGREHY